jgi:serine/threonine protein kinase
MSDSVRAFAEGPEDDPVEALLVECMDRVARGETGAVEEACAGHPEHALEIRERMGMILRMGLLRSRGSGPEGFPERLGEFRLVRRLGGGGMGVVYHATQEPLGREVALKLIRPEHLYFPRARERFRRETEAVAKLQHPGIVAIHTVGEEQGIPFFAMEMVAGATLAEVLQAVAGRAPESLRGRDMCAAIRARLSESGRECDERDGAVFAGSWVDACAGVVEQIAIALDHAHSRKILHRDVKPSNVVVTPAGRAVLVDFGLASAESELRMTMTGSALGSLLYMAPEQVRGDFESIDARTDVYALGVTLYELLTLHVPYFGEGSESVRAAILDGRPASIRARNRTVSRDLETVCLKAMESEPPRRYASMDEFARDLSAALAGRPIQARPPSALSRAQRWVLRNRAPSAVIALTAALVVGTPLALYFQQRQHARSIERALRAETQASRAAALARADAERERDNARLEARDAEEVAGFLVALFGAPDPFRSRGREPTARELLARGLERVETKLAGQPELQARLLERIGQSYSNLDLYSEALAPMERALALRRELHGECDPRTARTLSQVGKLHRLQGSPKAIPLLREAQETLREVLGAATGTTIQAQAELATALIDRGERREAIELLEDALAEVDGVPGDSREVRLIVLSALAFAHASMQHHAEGERYAREALAVGAELHGELHASRVGDMNSLAVSLQGLGRLDEAETTLEELVALSRELYGERSTAHGVAEMNLGVLLEARGRLDEAEALYRRSSATLRGLLGASHPHAVQSVSNLGNALIRRGRYQEARALFASAADEIDAALGASDRAAVYARFREGLACEALGDLEQAERVLRGAIASAAPERFAWLDLALASVLRRGDEGRDEARRVFEIVAHLPDESAAVEALYGLGILALQEDRRFEAEEYLRRASEMQHARAVGSWANAASRCALGCVIAARGGPEEGAALALEGLRDLEARLGPAHLEVLDSLERAAGACDLAGRRDAALALRQRARAPLAVR